MPGRRPAPPPTAVDALVADLAAGGRPEQPATFTLDRAVALEKLAAHQLEDPGSLVLELVQAAVWKGATRIAFRIDAADLRLDFDGRPFALADLEGLYETALSTGGGPDLEARRALAIALQAALRRDLAGAHLASGDGRTGVTLACEPGRADVFGPCDGAGPGTSLHLRWRRRARTLLRAAGGLPEEALLRERCARSPAEITVDGRQISGQRLSPGCLVTLPITGPWAWGAVGLDPDRPDRCLHLLRAGVELTEVTWPMAHGDGTGAVAVVDAPDLETDLSRRRHRKDDAYRQVLEAVAPGFDAIVREAGIRYSSLPDARSWVETSLGKAGCWTVCKAYHPRAAPPPGGALPVRLGPTVLTCLAELRHHHQGCRSAVAAPALGPDLARWLATSDVELPALCVAGPLSDEALWALGVHLDGPVRRAP